MASAYEQGQTNWDRGVLKPDAEDVPVEAAGEGSPGPGPDPNDQWGTADYLAQQGIETTTIERDIMVVFERRATIARRMADGAKRKDQQMVAQAAQDWLRSEVRLYDLFQNYTSHVTRRNEMVGNLPDELRGQILKS